MLSTCDVDVYITAKRMIERGDNWDGNTKKELYMDEFDYSISSFFVAFINLHAV